MNDKMRPFDSPGYHPSPLLYEIEIQCLGQQSQLDRCWDHTTEGHHFPDGRTCGRSEGRGHRARQRVYMEKRIQKYDHKTRRDYDIDSPKRAGDRCAESRRDDRLRVISMSPVLLDARVPTLRNRLSSTAMRLQGNTSV